MDPFKITNVTHFFPTLMSAVFILLIGVIIAYGFRTLIKRNKRFQYNQILKSFLNNLIFTIILILTFITFLSKLGIPTASLVAVMGAASLAIGLSLRDFLANVAAGFMIVFLKPFKVGDSILINGLSGTIIDINLFMTQLRTASNENLLIPNNKVITNPIINQTYYPERRVDLVIGVDYDANLKQAKSIIMNVIQTNPLCLKSHEPTIGVQELANSSINLQIQFWTETSNILNVKSEVLESLKERLISAGINLPFPQLEVHVSTKKSALT